MASYESVGVPGVRAWASRREVVRVDAAMARGHGALPRAGTRGLSQAGRIHSIYTVDIYTTQYMDIKISTQDPPSTHLWSWNKSSRSQAWSLS